MNAYQVPTDPTAVMGRRFVAWIIDLLLMAAVFGGFAAANGEQVDLGSDQAAADLCELVTETGEGFCANVGSTVYFVEEDDFAVATSLAGLVGLVNGFLLTGATGASVGKLLLGLRVIRRDTGATCGFGKAFLRWLLWIVDGTCLIGPITALATKGHRRVGDMAAGTLVVATSSVGTVPFVPGLDGPAVNPAPWGGAAPAWGSTAPPPPAVPSGGTWGTAPAPGGTPPPPAPGGGWTVGTPPATDWTAPPPGDFGAPPAPLSSMPSSEPVAPSQPVPAEQPGVDAPMWDEARGTYIQWDPTLQQWMQWDDVSKQWTEIG